MRKEPPAGNPDDEGDRGTNTLLSFTLCMIRANRRKAGAL
jgi:hypothetical protein